MWEMRIESDLRRTGKKIMFIEPTTRSILQKDFVTADIVPVGEAIDEDIYVHYIPDDIFQALVDSVHKNHKPSEGKYTEGKLEATENHLKDLRSLLKLK